MNNLSTIQKYFHTHKNILVAYLFGSRALDSTGPMSDYDIGIYVQHCIDFQKKFFIEIKLRKILKTQSLDLIVMNSAPIVLNYNIVKGKCIYSINPQTRVEIEADIMSRYFDYLPVLIKHHSDIIGTVRDEQQVQRNRIAFAKTERLLAEIRAAQK